MSGEIKINDLVSAWHGHVLELLGGMVAGSVHCVVTSPPYWGLRDYGIAAVKWPTGWVGCHGLEPSVDLYVEHAVLVFREVRRVLRGDGTLWLNLGDTYAGGGLGGGGGFAQDGIRMAAEAGTDKNVPGRRGSRLAGGGLKPKDLVGVPWRVALALQADGWFLRMDNIWNKPNPMPESCKDRATRAHEYVFLLSKSRHYYYDRIAVQEPVSGTAHARGNGVNGKAKLAGRNSRVFRERDLKHTKDSLPRPLQARGVKQNASFSGAVSGLVAMRNRRSVWTIGTAPYREAHFATFPPALAELCIKAGTSEGGCCGGCGSPAVRVTAKGAANVEHQRACGGDVNGEYRGQALKNYAAARAQNASDVKRRILAGMLETRTVGWKLGCKCVGGVTGPCIVLDPFGGSGTVGMVAGRLSRRALLLDLNGEYIGMMARRCGAEVVLR